MENVVLNFILCLIEYSCIMIFMHNLLVPRFRSFIPLTAVIAACSVIVNSLQEFSYLKIAVCLLVVFLGAHILFRAKAYIISAFAFTYLYMLCIIDVVSGNILSIVLNKEFLDVFYSDFGLRVMVCLSVKAINILILIAVYKAFKKTGLVIDKKSWILFNVVMFVFLLVTVIYMEIYPTTIQNENSARLYTIISASFFIMSIIVIYFFVSICMNFKQKEKMYLLQTSYELIEERLSVQKQNSDKLKKIRHDMKNHLINTRILIEKGDTGTAIALIDDIIGQTESISFSISQSTGDAIIDSVITYKAALCENKKIYFEYELSLLPEIKVDYADISSVISNLFDNAIEAAEKTHNPFIKLKITEHGSYINIFIKNRCKDIEVSENNSLITGKEDADNHGFGTQIIKEISEKYDGTYSWKAEKEYFIANVILKNI